MNSGYTTKAISEKMGVTNQTVLNWIHNGVFKGVYKSTADSWNGSSYMVPESEVEALASMPLEERKKFTRKKYTRTKPEKSIVAKSEEKIELKSNDTYVMVPVKKELIEYVSENNPKRAEQKAALENIRALAEMLIDEINKLKAE